MDVELQILKHLARDAQLTVPVIDEYCKCDKDLFVEVRSYECLKKIIFCFLVSAHSSQAIYLFRYFLLETINTNPKN
ncbi:hypothetical protein H1P_5500001 [Hyella patelloides LEGE 07179]|uniref:Uncharacterized protein n=1 Tax=Hyella patelloides LEGE 07179 TaxID=945734 RepID=A0A563W0B1_9CYAN|nr:hypothetical protein [Hyella patelloides]VEP17119.1 hypothetical protein H1P_5500001 [Hyella patelloides LEGE 07179]